MISICPLSIFHHLKILGNYKIVMHPVYTLSQQGEQHASMVAVLTNLPSCHRGDSSPMSVTKQARVLATWGWAPILSPLGQGVCHPWVCFLSYEVTAVIGEIIHHNPTKFSLS